MAFSTNSAEGLPVLSAAELAGLLEPDLRYGDLTTRCLGIGQRPGEMRFFARQAMRLCAVEEAVGLLAGLGAEIVWSATSGAELAAGALILEVRGPAGALHAGWKMAQLVMEWASGVASTTAALVQAARAVRPGIAVLATRKSIPFTRSLALKAVLCGGGEVHRLGLYDSIMIFPEHLAFYPGGIAAAVAAARRHAPERAVMIEVTSLSEAEEAAAAGADVIQLEKFSPDQARLLMQTIRKRPDHRPIIAAAGGVTAQNAAIYAETGVDTLVTSAPFYAKPLDIQVEMKGRDGAFD